MKKHPILKYILILIVSGACGALVSYLIASREEQVVQAAHGLYQLFGQLVTPLHLSICLFLSLTAIVMTWQLRKKIDAATDETREQVYEQIENSPACNNTLAVSSLSTICNFFFLGAAIAYMQPKTILIAAHRISSISDCDEIYYMQDGEIVERGSFEELIAKGGRFAEIYKMQSEEGVVDDLSAEELEARRAGA